MCGSCLCVCVSGTCPCDLLSVLMPPEPLPWDRKDFFKERKHERSDSGSIGYVARWREPPPHHEPREFGRWGSGDFRRPRGHGKQGGWHMFPKDSGHGFAPSRSTDRIMEDEGYRPFVSCGDGKYLRNSRENRGGPLCQRDLKGQCLESSAVSSSTPSRQIDSIRIRNSRENRGGSSGQKVLETIDVSTCRHPDVNDQRSVGDMILDNSLPHSDFVNSWDQPPLKGQHDKNDTVDGMGTGHRHERENSLGSIDWRPLKWNRSGSLSSRGSGFSNSSSSKSTGVDIVEAKTELKPSNVTPVQAPSGDTAPCPTSVAPLEDTCSRKKQRLGWGEGLAKYEKKKVDGPDESVNKNTETVHSMVSNLSEKSPGITGFSDCASPATPSSVACSSSPGIEDRPFIKSLSVGNDTSNLSGSPASLFQNHLEGLPMNLGNLDMKPVGNLSSSIVELMQSDDLSSVDSSFLKSTSMNKLLSWKGDILKALEVTESEIDQLETELKSLKFEPGSSCPDASTSSVLPSEDEEKLSKEQVFASNLIPRPTLLQVLPGNIYVDKMQDFAGSSEGVHNVTKDDDIDSPGTATSKFIEPVSLGNASMSSDAVKHLRGSGAQDGAILSLSEDVSKLTKNITTVTGSGNAGECAGEEDILCDILTYNKDIADRSSEIFNSLLPKDHFQVDNPDVSRVSCRPNDILIKDKFVKRKQSLKFKEKVVTLKFRALLHLWKEDVRLLSVSKSRVKSQKKVELSSRMPHSGYQKYRSSMRARFSSPGNLSQFPTTEVITCASKLLADNQVKLYRNTLKMPALILDNKEKMASRFISSNALVEDPCAVEKERAMINPWTSEEKEIFMDKLAVLGKDFRKIACFLDHKTTADCVEFYYKNHKSNCFEKTKKKSEFRKQDKSLPANTYLLTSGKKWNRETNATSLHMLGAASVLAANDSVDMRKTCSRRLLLGYKDYNVLQGDKNCFNVLGNDKEAVAADVLVGIYGSVSSEAMSSCITSSADPGESYRKCQKPGSLTKKLLTPEVMQNIDDDDETFSDESCGEMDSTDWTDEEKSLFVQAVSSYGKDFAMISQRVRTRSRNQCKVFFSKARKCLKLDLIHSVPGTEVIPMSDDANGGGSGTEDGCVVETNSGICSNKSGSKMGVDVTSSVLNICHDDSDPGGNMNLLIDTNMATGNNCTGAGFEDPKSSEVPTPEYQVEDKPKQILEVGDCNADGESGMSAGPQYNTILPVNMESKKDESHPVVGETLSSLDESQPPVAGEALSSLGELHPLAAGESPSGLDLVVETKAVVDVSVDGHGKGTESEQQKLPSLNISLDDGGNENKEAHTIGSGRTGVFCSLRKSKSVGDTSDLTADMRDLTSNFRFPKPEPGMFSELNGTLKSAVSLEDSSLMVADAMANQAEAHIQHVSLLPTNFEELGENQHRENPARLGNHQQCKAEELSAVCADSSPNLRAYPLHTSIKKETSEDIGCTRPPAVPALQKVDSKLHSGHLATGCCLQRCNGSKSHRSAADTEQNSNHPKTHARSLSDTENPTSNGNVKLFGQILSHPLPLPKANTSSIRENESKVAHQQPKSINLKLLGHHHEDQSFGHSNYLGLENLPAGSYGIWNGNGIQNGYSSMPEPAILLAKYSAAFCNQPASASKMEQQSLQTVMKDTEHALNGIPFFTGREMSNSSVVADLQTFRNRDGLKVPPPVVVDMKQEEDVYAGMQRLNSFESGLQQHSRGVVGMNSVEGGVLLGGACPAVSDPVAAIKMHYANTDQYSGQVGSIIREEETWREAGNLRR